MNQMMKNRDGGIKKIIKKRIEVQRTLKKMNKRNKLRTTGTPPSPIDPSLTRDEIRRGVTKKEVIKSKVNVLVTKDEIKTIIHKTNIKTDYFKNKKNNFTVGAIYNSFYGLELIEKSINSIRNCVDYIVVVHQKIGFNGASEPLINAKILKRLLENNLVDEIIYYDNQNELTPHQGVVEKRNIGLEYCKKNNCTFIMAMDCDELYDSGELIKELSNMYVNNIDTLYSPIYVYYYDEQHYYKATYFVSSIYRVNNRKFKLNKKSSVRVDLARKMEEGTYEISNMYMHHYSHLIKYFSDKVKNQRKKITLIKSVEEIKDAFA